MSNEIETETEGALLTAINALNMALIVLDGDFKVELINKTFHEIWDTPEDLLKPGVHFRDLIDYNRDRGFYDISHAEWEAYVLERQEEIRSGDVAPREFVRPDGVHLLYSVTSLSNDRRLVTYFNITEQKSAEKQLKQEESLRNQTLRELEAAVAENIHSRNRFRAFAESNSDWFWEMDDHLRFSFFSETFEEVTGVPPAKLLGRTRSNSPPPGVSEEALKAHLDLLDAHEPFRDFIHSRERRPGETVWLSISGTPVFDHNGEFTGYVGSGLDVTDKVEKQRAMEEAMLIAEAAEKSKSEFLANMSHEIRTPMNGVMGMAELLSNTKLDAKQKMFTDVMIKSGTSLLTIINDILDFSKIDAGKMELAQTPFNLAEAVEDVATLISAKVSEKDLKLLVRVDPSLPQHLIGDAGRLRQVITNLISNAVKFTEFGHIYTNVSCIQINGKSVRLRISVEDTGIGIPEDKLHQVFKKFNQVDNSATREHEGTGLGLAIASSLVRLMGGEIQLESEVGKGSTFSFEIEMPIAQQSSEELDSLIPSLHGSHVLIIDDNAFNRSIMVELLSAKNLDCATANSGQEGLGIIEAATSCGMSVDLVILDYQISNMTGVEVLEQLRSNSKTKNIPVLVMTSVDSPIVANELNEAGASISLTKPTRSSLLLETIAGLLSEHKRERNTTKVIAQDEKLAEEIAKTQQLVDESVEEIAPFVSLEEPEKEETISVSQREPIDVLVAEDNHVNQIVFTQILEELGVHFKMVSDGIQALEAFQRYCPRVILMDVSMPEMNGQQATQKIRTIEEQQRLQRTPIVGVTAHALKGDREECIDCGMDDYVTKPVSPNILIKKLLSWLEEPADNAQSA